MKKTYQEETRELAPQWAKEWPLRIILALDWRYFAVAFKDMTKEAVIADITTIPFTKSADIGPTMRKRICELLGVEYRTKPLTEAEQRIKELEAKVTLLETIARNFKSDPGDSDLVSSSDNWTILSKMYGGYAVRTSDSTQWEDFESFDEMLQWILNHKKGK